MSHQLRRASLAAVLMLLVVPSALRYGIGTDYFHYVNLFNQISLNGISGAYTELGFNALVLLLSRFGLSAQSLFIVSSVLLGIALWMFITRCVDERYWGLFVFLFISFGFYFSSFNAVRQYISFSICLLAFSYLEGGDTKRFVLLVLFACLFHTVSAVLFIVPLFSKVMNGRFGFRIMSFCYVASLLFIVVDVRPLLSGLMNIVNRWSWYSNSDFFTDRNVSAVLKLVVPNLLMIWMFVRGMRRTTINGFGFLSNKAVSGGILYIYLQNAFFGVMILTRVSEMFGMCFICWLIQVVSRSGDGVTRFFFQWLLYGYGIALTVVTIFIMNGHDVIPYQSLFS